MSTPRASLPPLPSTVRLLTNAESDALNQRYPNAQVSVAHCITCHGKKTFRWYAGHNDNRQPVEYDCPCADQYVLHRWLLNAGIMLNYQRLGWGDFMNPDPVATAAVAGYVEKHEAYVNAGIGMVLSGSRGNGKSLFAFMLLKALIHAGVNTYATTFSDMIDTFASGWQDRAQARWFDRTVRNAGVLYIDDLGRERNKGPASVGENMLETVVRSRVASNQPTIISTNLTRDDIHAGYGGHVMSLLTERSMIVEVSGSDHREQIRHRTLDEVEQGLTRPVVLA